MSSHRRAADLAADLGRHAEAVCRRYLSNGQRQGNHWIVGDLANTPGRSLYVRLNPGRGAAGRWTDAATGEYGDLLDLIRHTCSFSTLREAMIEAGDFLALPRSQVREEPRPASSRAPGGSPERARRLFRSALPIHGTLAATYLAGRGLVGVAPPCLRFHPNCYCRLANDAPPENWPALLAAITNLDGVVQGVHRTFLGRDGSAKAPIADPRRSMGRQLGNGVRLAGAATHLLVAGEGLETVLSIRAALPGVPMVAGLSATHLAALLLPRGLARLYIARDSDGAGRRAAERLRERAERAGIPDVLDLYPYHDDFNTDLQRLGPHRLAGHIAAQLAGPDRAWVDEAACGGAGNLA